jgi:hypothetical protein
MPNSSRVWEDILDIDYDKTMAQGMRSATLKE